MSARKWVEYQFSVLRVVPHVYRGEFVNVGVLLHSRTAEFLAMQAITDPEALRLLAPDADVDLLSRYLTCYGRICDGDETAGEIAFLSRPERFHWLSAPRSDLLQSSPVHEGIGKDPRRALDEIYSAFVGPARSAW
jgi:hypothetical protein